MSLALEQTILGGLATSGLIYVYLPLSGETGEVVTSGISEELLLASVKYGPFELPRRYTSGSGECCEGRYACCFSPAGFALTLDKLLRDAGVEVRFETAVIGARCDGGNRLVEAELFCGAEKDTLSAECFIDASGGAFLLRMAGAEVFPERNIATPWIIEFDGSKPADPHYPIGEGVLIRDLVDVRPCDRFEQALSADGIVDFTARQYAKIREYFDAMPPEEGKRHYPLHLPAMPQLRKIARIDGMSLIGDGDVGAYREDSVGVAADWRKIAPSWETPYGALVPRRIRGALAAGRCIAAAGEAWEIFRVIPAAAMTGEAAGVAAAMSCERGVDPSALPVADLQERLRRGRGIMHISEAKRI